MFVCDIEHSWKGYHEQLDKLSDTHWPEYNMNIIEIIIKIYLEKKSREERCIDL